MERAGAAAAVKLQRAPDAADAVCNIVGPITPKAARGFVQQGSSRPPAGAFSAAQPGVNTVVTAAPAEQTITPLASAQYGTVVFNDPSTPMRVETPLFSGQALLLLRNMPNTPAYFNGKRRQMVLTIQGRFKQPGVSLDSLMLGSDFTRPLKLPAAPLISHAVTWLALKLGGGVSVQVAGQTPHILAPLIAAAQVVNVAQPGQQPPDLLAPVEDMRLFDARLVNTWTGQPLTAKQRRSHFSRPGNRHGRCFDTQHVWTFQMYEHILDYSSFLLNMPLLRLDMVQLLDGQPLQLMLKDVSSGYSMLHLTVWHRRMLQHPANKAAVGDADGSFCEGAESDDAGS